MSVVVVTGATGLIGSEAVHFFHEKGLEVVGIDNDLRAYFFGSEASTAWNLENLKKLSRYTHFNVDIRNIDSLQGIFRKHGTQISAVVHAAAQPSHDWAAKEPLTDFSINANGTLNLLEAVRQECPEAVFIHCSTNKVYGDTPNSLPLIELESRWEIEKSHPFYANGIDESMSIDASKHSLFGVSKCAGDLMVQEYGRYFGMKTAIFRGGCLTGPKHSGAQLHGFLSYLVKCAVTGSKYTIFGYKGKQVRDNIHAYDLVNAFWHFYEAPRCGEVYNIGGGRYSNCSMQEAIAMCEKHTNRSMNIGYAEENRSGDHIWWISDTRKFKNHYPNWSYKYNINDIVTQIFSALNGI